MLSTTSLRQTAVVSSAVPGFLGRCSRELSSASSPQSDLYRLLGLDQTATAADIKQAFRRKAKEHHPDASGDPAAAAGFGAILGAYRTLSDPAARRLYDLQHDTSTASFLRDAAAHRREHGERSQQPDWQWDWVPDLEEADNAPAPRNRVDRLRSELRAEFRDALLHAYHGPQVDMAAQQLPECFEADERSDPAAADVLQLVSGRQLLGVVRERAAPLLGDAATAAVSVPPRAPVPRIANPIAAAAAATAAPDDVNHLQSAAGRSGSHDGAAEQSGSSRRGPAARAAPRAHLRQVLELLLDGHEAATVATMTRVPPGQSATFEVHRGGTLVYREDGRGRVFTPAGRGEGNGGGACEEGVDGGSRHSHAVVVSRTPFVKHLDFIARAGVGGLKKDRLLCRCKRAWLPSSATWLFPPRSASHCTGGWYLEWPGYKHSGHAAWLDPAIFVLRAAFETLEAERAETAARAAQQSEGIWARLKAKLSRETGT